MSLRTARARLCSISQLVFFRLHLPLRTIRYVIITLNISDLNLVRRLRIYLGASASQIHPKHGIERVIADYITMIESPESVRS